MKNKQLIKEINRTKTLMGLTEEFKSTLSDDLPVAESSAGYYVQIAEDNETGDILTLYIGFTPKVHENYDEFLYGVVILDKDHAPKTNVITSKKQTNKLIPVDIVNRGVLFPIVQDYTNKSIDRFKPQKVLFRTDDKLTTNFLKRLDIIINVFLNKGYKMESKNEIMGSQYIKFNKDDQLNEETDKSWDEFIKNLPSIDERNRIFGENLREELRTIPNMRNCFKWMGHNKKQIIEESVKGKKIEPDKYVYYKTTTNNRYSIEHNGIYPSVDESNIIYENKQIPIIITIPKPNSKTTSDVWQIDTTKCDNEWFMNESNQLITLTPITKESLKLINEQ